jgi:hypothetical protein
MITTGKFLTAAQIASGLGTYKSKIRRLARREQWPVQKIANRLLYRVPRSLRRRLDPSSQPAAMGTFPPAISAEEKARLRRVQFRFEAVCALEELLASRVLTERALRQVATSFSFHTSPTSLRRWQAAYRRDGFEGLQERKLGHSGCKRAKA